MIRKLSIAYLFVALVFIARLGAQPAGYYDSANGLTETALQQALHNIIDDHTVLSYTPGLWNAVQSTDDRADGTVWDMYSDNPTGTNPYNFTFVTDQCGNYNSEADCYNREHSFPKSWFGGSVLPMYTDLNHIFPTDGYVNNRRGNFAFGETSSPTWTSQNGSKLGSSSVQTFTGTVFEPIDEYKGDFARAHFYMAIRYYNEDSSWPGSDMTDGAQPKAWAIDMLIQWHKDDPVSQKEIDRNNEVYNLQNNRNPFIDNPSYVDKIWGTSTSISAFSTAAKALIVYPNPIGDELKFRIYDPPQNQSSINIYSLLGTAIYTATIDLKAENTLPLEGLAKGSYILLIRSNDILYREIFVVTE